MNDETTNHRAPGRTGRAPRDGRTPPVKLMQPVPPIVAPAAGGHQKPHSSFDRFAGAVTRAVGTPVAFVIALSTILAWAITGPMFGFSETWQLVVNTGTTIVTFLMVFLIQQSQNKDSVAVHLKLNELLASHHEASNRVVAVEDLDETELQTLREFYCKLAEMAKQNGGVKETHSLDEAEEQAIEKLNRDS
jgi:low affinity Fe/Cu permease